MKDIILLAAGQNTKMFPFDLCTPKHLRNVLGKPLIRYNIESFRTFTSDPIHIMCLDDCRGMLADSLRDIRNIHIHTIDKTQGTSDTVSAALPYVLSDSCVVLYADTYIKPQDLQRLYNAQDITVLAFPRTTATNDAICLDIDHDTVTRIGAHLRNETFSYVFGGFHLTKSYEEELRCTPEFFPGMKVGQAAPKERYLEASLYNYCKNHPVRAIIGQHEFFDIDKPWDLYELNLHVLKQTFAGISDNTLSPDSCIDPTAIIEGKLIMGNHTKIGRNVIIRGNVILDDNSIIDNGSILLGDTYIGKNSRITDYAQVFENTIIGNDCILGHCVEFLGGLMMDKVYLYHHGELYGIFGNNVDVGAGTNTGTLRFDDQLTTQKVNGRRQQPKDCFNMVCIGDYTRLGVSVTLQPGMKVGANCAIGAGIVISKDIPHNTRLLLKQEYITTPWGPDRYGW